MRMITLFDGTRIEMLKLFSFVGKEADIFRMPVEQLQYRIYISGDDVSAQYAFYNLEKNGLAKIVEAAIVGTAKNGNVDKIYRLTEECINELVMERL